MAKVRPSVVDAMRNNNAIGPRWKVVIESLKRRTAADSSFAIQLAQMLLRFRIDRKPRVAVGFVLLDPLADPAKLCIAISMFSTGKILPDLSIPYSGVTKPSGDGVVSNWRPYIG